MNGRGARRKGIEWERELVWRFREVMPGAEVRRGFQTRSGDEAADVDLPRFWIEAKRHQRTNIKAALRQAVDAAPPDRWPVAVCKDDREPAIASMRLEDFLALVREWWEATRS